MGSTAATRVGWEADLDDGLDWIRDVDNAGWWDRSGSIFLARASGHWTAAGGAPLYDLWVHIPARWVERRIDRRGVHLFPEYVGPDLPVCEPTAITVARWFPGTSSAHHAYNPRAWDYVRTCSSLPCDEAKRQSVATLEAMRAYLLAGGH